MMADEQTTTEPETAAGAAQPSPAADPAAPAPAAERTAADEAAEAKDRLIRTLAEMENLRRRTEREIADARQYAVANFAREMLAVGDNLRRAIEAVPREEREHGDKALAALIEGVEVTERGLEQSLTKFGVRRIEAKGQKFDPSVHQAMFEVETDDVPPGTVADEIEVGYVINGRVLKPALVAVAKKKAEKPAEPPAAPANDTPAAAGSEGG
jgi:molecular chaperone GrpE